MCIVFFYFNDNPGPDGYKLIIASNRDEFYQRPTGPAKFWETNPNVIGGVDLFPGREGGTWFGISKTGKIGIVTNYRQSPELISDEALGRGHLATDFLNSTKSVEEYMSEIQCNGHQYNGFNLLLGELSFTSETKMLWYCNLEEKVVQKLPPGYHGLSNRLLNFPWPKLVFGKDKFTEIIGKAGSKDDMVEDIFMLLNERRRHFPDEDDSCYTNNPLDKNYPPAALQACRAIFVHLPEFGYGTRTNTVVVVDTNGHVTFTEKTLADGAHDPDNKDCWITNHHEFEMLNITKE